MRLWVLLFAASLVWAQDFAAKADEYLNAHRNIRGFMGSVLVARQGQVLLGKGYGFANAEHEVPNTARTKFRLGSITKQFTSMAVAQLAERGKLGFDDSICKFIDNCPDLWKPLTIHHLLTHTSGIWNFTNSPDYTKEWMIPSPPAKTMLKFRDKPLEFEPGSKFSYSNSGYILLALIVEKAAGSSYESFLRKNIFDPVGMNDSGHDTFEAILKYRAAGYTMQGGKLTQAPYHDMSIPIGAGDLYSTVEDLYKWDQALYTDKLVKPETQKKIFTPFKGDYAYGWMVARRGNRNTIAHGGGINGFSTVIQRFPDERATVIVLSNNITTPAGPIGDGLAAILFGESYTTPKPRTESKVDPKLYDSYIGKYQLTPNFALTITRDGDRLMAQATNQPQFEVFPESDTKFFLKVVDAQITFVKEENGKVNQLVLHQNGRDMPAKRAE